MEHEKLQKAERRAKQQELNLTGIPIQMKWELEAQSGLSLDDVRVHYHSDKPARLGALAYTQGTQIHIGPGQEGHLRHELGHVVQQKLGLVRPNARIPGGPALNTEEALERQADAIGAGQTVLNAGVPPVQRCEAPVVQAAGHITLISHVALGEDEVELAAAESPTIVFEAMGVSREECEAIYAQTKGYNGNTICVFGLNARPNVTEADFNRSREALNAFADRYNQGGNRYNHLLYTFSFRWTPITERNRGYPMPFVEARVLVMREAAAVVDRLRGAQVLAVREAAETVDQPQEEAAAPAMPPQYSFLYRWIDADARDDTTASLDPELLGFLAKMGRAVVVTGRYDWRSDTPGSRGNYEAFIKEFNQAERELRDCWYNLKRERPAPASGESSGSGDEKTMLEALERSYLPGFYFPETALMMNEIAHTGMTESFSGIDGAQDKESMKLVNLLNLRRDLKLGISYQSGLSVTKPLKNEFTDGTYWGSDMLSFLRDRRRPEADFIVALKNVRQSAFNPGNWYFIKNEDWSHWETTRASAVSSDLERKQALFNQKRKELETRLFNYLTKNIIVNERGREKTATMRQLIAGEIPAPPA